MNEEKIEKSNFEALVLPGSVDCPKRPSLLDLAPAASDPKLKDVEKPRQKCALGSTLYFL